MRNDVLSGAKQTTGKQQRESINVEWPMLSDPYKIRNGRSSYESGTSLFLILTSPFSIISTLFAMH
ncbi:MAG: hypothetical protein JWO89_2810 [Verrucomicrobiaceae bacterium]|nr:hypothetical protein [Verrucomicrobiaceae bacterium]